MPRPSANTDRLLIEAGRALFPKAGCTGLNLREVAKKAGVNLGMFHYHFKNKQEFTRRILQTFYEEFFQSLQLEVSADGDPAERLRRVATTLATFSRDNRKFMVALFRDVLNGDPEVIRFLQENVGRHIRLLAGLIAEGQKKRLFRKMPLPVALSFFGAGVNLPAMMFEVVERTHPKNSELLEVTRQHAFSNEAIALRVEMGMRALCVAKEGGPQ